MTKMIFVNLPVADLPRAVHLHREIVAGVTNAGYRYVTLDLAGFRSGSLNGNGGHSSSIALMTASP